MKKFNLEDFLAGGSLAAILLLFGSFLFNGAKVAVGLVVAAGILGAMLLLRFFRSVHVRKKQTHSVNAHFRIIKQGLAFAMAVLMTVMLPVQVFANEEIAVTESTSETAAETLASTEQLTALREQIELYMQTYKLALDMSDGDLANAYFVLDSDGARAAWLEANELLALAGELSSDDADILEADENSKLCLRFYDIMVRINSPMVMDGGQTIDDKYIKISCSGNATIAKDGATITITLSGTMSGCTAVTQEDTITVENTSDKTATIVFTWSKNGDGSTSLSTSPYSKQLDAGGTDTFKITSPEGSDSSIILTLSDFEYTAAQETSKVTFHYSAGDVKVAGTSVGGTGESATIGSEGAEIETTGDNFIAWVNNEDNRIVSTSANFTLKPAKDMEIKALFGPTACFQVGPADTLGYMFDDLTKAADCAAANASSTTVVLANNGTLPAGDYSIPTGVTLLIPFDSANTLVSNNAGSNLLDAYNATITARSQYRKLTMSSGANITVYGAISVSSKLANQFIGQVGPYGAVYMEDGSNITVESGGTLYAWGYIFHGTSGSGTVTVKSGGTVYEPISIMDYPGSSSLATSLTDNKVFPMRSYSIRNVEVPMTLNSGAREYVFSCLYGSNFLVGTNPVTELLIANGKVDNKTPVFQNSGTITKSYVNSRMCVIVSDNVTLNPLAVVLTKGAGSYSLSSSATSGFYIPSCWDMTIASGTTTINDNIIMCEGSTFTIDQGATVDTNGKNVYVLDADNDPGAVGSENSRANGCGIDVQNVHKNYYTYVPKDAVLDVNGKLIASGGFYTSAAGACITSSKSGGVVEVKATSADVSIGVKAVNSASTVSFSAAKLLNGDDSFTETAGGTATYVYSGTGENGKWYKEFSISYASMTMANSLDMNFAFEKDLREDWTGYYAEIVKNYADGSQKKQTIPYGADWKTATINGKEHYYVTFTGIAAKEMTDLIHVTIKDAQGTAVSSVWDDSVQKQAMRNLSQTTSPLTQTMVVDMLNYGAAAQAKLAYNTGSYANSQLTAEQIGYATESVTLEANAVPNNYKANVLMESNIQFIMAFTGIDETMTAKITFADHYGQDKSYDIPGSEFTVNNGTYTFTISKTVVADGWQEINCKIMSGDTVQTEVTDSIACYAARAYANTENELYTNLLKFSDSAYKYLHNKLGQ